MSTIASKLDMASEEDFCKDYLLLNPKEAGFSDLLRIFYSCELYKRDFFDAPEADSLRGLRRRWVVFVSVVAQMLLLQLKKPLAGLGSTLELLLNYPSSNGGFGGLLLHFLTGLFEFLFYLCWMFH